MRKMKWLSKTVRVCVAIAIMLSMAIVPVGEKSVDASDDLLSIEQTKLGNVFLDNEQAVFGLQTKGDSISWEVYDLWNTKIAEGKRAAGSGELRLTLPIKELGYYLLKVSALEDGEVIDQVENSFSILSPYNFDNINDSRFAIGTHFGQFKERPEYNPETGQYETRGVPNQDPEMVPLIKMAGVNQVRDELPWNNVEPEKGKYVFPDTYNDYIGELERHGLSSLSIFNYGNKLYDVDKHGIGAAPYTDEGREAYANYGKALLDQYGSQIKDVEVWNEYNGNAPWNRGPCRMDTKCYYEMLKETYTTVKAAHPDVRVTGPAGVTLPYGWLENLFKLGALEYLDVVTVHPYGFPNSPEKGYKGPNLKGVGLEARIQQLQELIKKYNNGESKPIYFTEIGWGTQQNDPRGVKERTQAQYLVRTHVMSFAAGVEKVFWYEFKNSKVLPEGPGANFGMVRHEKDPKGKYAPKPSYVSYSVMTRQLSEAEFVSKDSTPEDVRSYVFRKGDQDTRVIWTAEESQNITVESDEAVTVTDMMGKEETYHPYEGKVYLTVSEDPLYVKGNVKGISVGSMVSLNNDQAVTGEKIPLTLTVDNSESSRSVPVKLDIHGEKVPFVLTAKKGEKLEKEVLVRGQDMPGTRKVIADVRIRGKLAGKVSTEVEILEPLNLKDDKAVAILKSEPELYGIEVDGLDAGQFVTKDGREGWSTDKSKGALYSHFNVDDRYIYDNKEDTIKITVDYFDEGNGHFALAYDSHNANYKYTGTVKLTDSKTWKSHTFELDDAKFANRQRAGKTDFRLGIYSPALGVSSTDVIFSSVSVEK
jgi:hypothetical protein